MLYLVGSLERSLDCTGVGAYYIPRHRNIEIILGRNLFYGIVSKCIDLQSNPLSSIFRSL